ncbi:SIMPL domain-containing protein [Undibacterium sp. LX40W]|uniref:SIMPL domain-containing protein n=1 Tax=Undibacterium nitidum TaxID=2762298 RepID=A0A923KLP2_9BURK|nr:MULTISPECIES: SIMPL domain-containing protein [Undibacterium]MBC3882060.1 SIMPL domain-containing protein [Undibacterium nitidum]MBC3892341.1 SIMPL domain-containing protein [Undibacterium sp. LX40W]
MRVFLVFLALFCSMNVAPAQELGKDSRLLIAGTSSLKFKNDRAVAWFSITEEGKDKEVAASAVNKRAKLILDQLKTNYQEVEVTTSSYSVESIEEEVETQISPTKKTLKSQRIGWRVRQSVSMRTTALDTLPKLISEFQQKMELDSLGFELSEAAQKRAEKDRLDAAYQNLFERMNVVAQIMGKKSADFLIDSIDFDGIESRSGRYQTVTVSASSVRRKGFEPSFEPGTTNVEARVEARVRMK